MNEILAWALVGAAVAAIILILSLLTIRKRFADARKVTALVQARCDGVTERLMKASSTLADAIFLKIVDWGPDFTGQGDVLHRYRWTLWHRDVAIDSKELLMLGNSPSYAEAVMDAFSWIEQQANPGVEVALWGAEDLTESL